MTKIQQQTTDKKIVEDDRVEWQVRAIRGATTASENSERAVREVVTELLDELEEHNLFNPEQIVSVIFSVTRDLDAIFPAAIARKRPQWDSIPLLDLQHMHVPNDLKYCIRLLVHINLPVSHPEVYHPYLRNARYLRPDWSGASIIPIANSHS
jgi:chorismate mutase